MAIAVYSGSFDPITNGHVDVIRRASCLFDRLVVAVGKHVDKSPHFNAEKRVALVKASLSGLSNVEVCAFDGLLVDFAQDRGIKTIIRSVRNALDFDYEAQMAVMNQQLDSALETVFLMPAPVYAHISSSLVRQIASMGGDVSGFVPSVVAKAFERN